ncbi:MAG: hypothetical protein IIA61_14130 [Candidatus Marinimicrobia bacterium]|nr:hypothetical protein [Candidatus Neomarinimicrobiota bacterium]
MENKIRAGRKYDSMGVLFQPDKTQFLPPEHDAVPTYEKGGYLIQTDRTDMPMDGDNSG